MELNNVPESFERLYSTQKKDPFKVPELIKDGQRNDTLYKIACSMRAKGHSEEEILGALVVTNKIRCQNPLELDEIGSIVASACSKTPGAAPKPKQNILLFLISLIKRDKSLAKLIGLNELTNDIEFLSPPPWDPLSTRLSIKDADEVHLKVYLSDVYGFEPKIALIREAIMHIAQSNRFHPIRDYIRPLVWDKVNRLDTWLIDFAGCEDSLYTRMVARKTLIAAVTRVFNPGVKFDYMLVLEGRGGIGKSRLVQAIAGKWSTEINITIDEKRVVEKMIGKWILEFSEMAGMRKADREHLKSFITTTSDRLRLAYRYNVDDFPRQNIFIGTMNPTGSNEWLSDDSGEKRRFWPVSCNKIDIQGFLACRDQLLAESYQAYLNGELLYIDDALVLEYVNKEQEERREIDPWFPIIASWVRGQMSKFTASDVLIGALGMDKSRIDRFSQVRVGKILKLLKINNKREGRDHIRYYFLDQCDQDATIEIFQ